jgi:hypothetical protein
MPDRPAFPSPTVSPQTAGMYTDQTVITANFEHVVQAWSGFGPVIWAVDIAIRASNAVNGLDQDQGRKLQRRVGANTVRLMRAAAPPRWLLEQAHQRHGMARRRSRPWYRQTCAPSPLDLAWACRDALHEAAVFPRPRFAPDRAENHEEQDHALPAAA